MKRTPLEPGQRPLLPPRLVRVSWKDLSLVGLPGLLILGGALWALVAFVRPAPPNVIKFLAGVEGSEYRKMAEHYKRHIESHGVRVELLSSQGSQQNLHRLADADHDADVGFVQSGMLDGIDAAPLVSLGTVFVKPLLVFYRGKDRLDALNQLGGKRLAVGKSGSGTRALAEKLLDANRLLGAVTLLPLDGEEAAHALEAGAIDVAFLTSDSASPDLIKELLHDPNVRLMNFRQAAGYARRFRWLSKLVLPEGALDLADNDPPETFHLVGATVELVARTDLHPALSDMLIAAAREVHGMAGLFQEAGEFPAPIEHELPISEDAERYYKSGGQLLYRRLPFWLASLIDRTLVVLLPFLVVIVPATKVLPALYRWRVRSRILRWYGALMEIERELLDRPDAAARAALQARLDALEAAVNAMKLPVAFADQLYVLREHVALVRHRLDAVA
jgi:TRAP-type uncharacterized transport system substrate-binding protein